MDIEQKYRLFWGVVYAFICMSIIHASPSFDGAMNLLPAKNLTLFGDYYSFYFEEYFPHYIQTRATLQLPAAFFIWIGGLSYFTVLIPSALYTFFFIFVSEKLVRKISDDHKINYFILPIFLCIPLFFFVGLHGWGEVITYFFILLSLLTWVDIMEKPVKKWTNYLIFGLFIGLAILTKTVALITLPAFALAFLFLVILERKIDFRYSIAIIGILIPIALYELTRYSLLGVEEYLSSWQRELHAVTEQAGISSKSKTSNSNSLIGFFGAYFNIFYTHLTFTALHTQMFIGTVILFFAMPFLAIFPNLFSAKVKKSTRVILLFLMTLIVGYLIWWFFISPTYKVAQMGKFRRVLPAFLMNALLISYYLKDKFSIKNKVDFHTIYGAILIGLCVFTAYSNVHKLIKIVSPNKERVINTKDIEYLNSLPDNARIYGIGYKQNPRVALLYNKHFYNFFSHEFDSIVQYPHSYILRDRYSSSTNAFNEVLEVVKHDTLIRANRGYEITFDLFKINGLQDDIVQKNKENELATCLVGKNITPYQNKLGLIHQGPIGNKKNRAWNWGGNRVGFLLNDNNASLLKLKLLCSPTKPYKRKDLKLAVFYNDNDIGTFDLLKRGNELLIPIPDDIRLNAKNAEIFLDLNTEMKFSITNKPNSYFGICLNEICLVETNENESGFRVDKFWVNDRRRLWMTLANDEGTKIDGTQFNLVVNGLRIKHNNASDNRILIQMSKELQEKKELSIFLFNPITNEKTKTYYLNYDKESNILSEKK